MRFLLLVIGIIVIYSIKAGIAHAQTEPVIEFGPKQYDKPKGHPVTYTDTFQAISTSGTHTIWVQNGKDCRNEVKHLSIALNGVEVINFKDLRAHNPATKPITVQPDNTITVTLNGKEGNFVTVKIFCEGCSVAPEVHIVFPEDGSTINASSTLVKGIITTDSHEVGIIVNGVLAEVAGNAFVANDVPLNIGENTLTAVATDAEGNTATDTITVHTNEYHDQINLTVDKTSGLFPMAVKFSIDTQINNQITKYEIDFEGDGIIDQTIGDTENAFFTYTQVGLYYPTITVTDDQGNRYADTIAVNVLSLNEIDTLLKAKWEDLGTALVNEDIEEALKLFTEDSREVYRGQFTSLSPILTTIGNELGYLRLVTIEDNRAEYEIITTRDGSTYSYFLLFERDQDGLWKIERF